MRHHGVFSPIAPGIWPRMSGSDLNDLLVDLVAWLYNKSVISSLNLKPNETLYLAFNSFPNNKSYVCKFAFMFQSLSGAAVDS